MTGFAKEVAIPPEKVFARAGYLTEKKTPDPFFPDPFFPFLVGWVLFGRMTAMARQLKILMIGAEVAPFSKTGGLADVLGSLPKALAEMGHFVIVVTPNHGVTRIRRKRLARQQGLEGRVLSRVPSPFDFAFRHIDVQIDDKNSVKFSFRQSELSPGVPIYFVDHYQLFGKYRSVYGHQDSKRFLFFNLASLSLPQLLRWRPDIIHAHDWHAGLVPYFLKTRFQGDDWLGGLPSLFTIHNLLFQGETSYLTEKVDARNRPLPRLDSRDLKTVNFMKRGILFADIVNTVSVSYAKEILDKKFGQGLEPYLRERREDLFGITNGIDYNEFNPSTDRAIRHHFNFRQLNKKALNKRELQREFGLPQSSRAPLIGIVSRITEQKGFDLFAKMADSLLRLDIQIVATGAITEEYRPLFARLVRTYANKIAIHRGFSEEIASRIYAGSDMFLMPSHFEPCGLGQLISLRYGSIPIVRRTGGLADTVRDYDPSTGEGNGFVFDHYHEVDLIAAIVRAITHYRYKKSWQRLVRSAMKETFTWEIPAEQYEKLYFRALDKVGKG